MKLRIDKNTKAPVEFPDCKSLIGMDYYDAQDEIQKLWKGCYASVIATGLNGLRYAEFNYNSEGRIVLVVDKERIVIDVFRFELHCDALD